MKKEKKLKKYLTNFFDSAIIIPVIRIAGIAQLVERQPSKLNVASSTLVSRSIFFTQKYASLAQLVEHTTLNRTVTGSSPV